MSWLTSWIPSFFAPAAAWLFALLVPVIIFYFLKLRRSRIEISSLALWQQVINDQRVNAPFQKFKRNLLLLLQLLLLCAVALAAMQPFWGGNAQRLNYLPILVDCSASMGAVGSDGKTRLDLAKEDILKIIDGLLPDQQLTLISVGATSQRLTEFTDNQPTLRQALSEIKVQDVPSRIEDGLRLTQALARTLPIERIRLYSDGNLPARLNSSTGQKVAEVNVDLPFALDFFQIPAAGANLGITSLNARRAALDRWDVFLRVDAAAAAGGEAKVVLLADGEPLGDELVILGPGESQRLVFGVDADQPHRLEARLQPAGADSLTSDNSAWLNLPAGRPLAIYCPTDLSVFRHALEGIDGTDVYPREGTESPARFDLVVSDQEADLVREAPLVVSIGMVPADLRSLIEIEGGAAEVVDWQRNAPLLQHVQLASVLISDLPKKLEGKSDADIEQLGYDILAHGNQGPLVLRKRNGPVLTYSFLFHTDRSTLPYRVGFPVVISNLIRETMQQAALDEVTSAPTGMLPPLQLTPGGEYRIVGPDGETDQRTAGESGELTGVAANTVGRYQVFSGNNQLDDVGVGLLSAQETSLAAADKINFNELTISAQLERAQQDQPLWRYLAGAALGLLLFEWWYFQKKPAGVPD